MVFPQDQHCKGLSTFGSIDSRFPQISRYFSIIHIIFAFATPTAQDKQTLKAKLLLESQKSDQRNELCMEKLLTTQQLLLKLNKHQLPKSTSTPQHP